MKLESRRYRWFHQCKKCLKAQDSVFGLCPDCGSNDDKNIFVGREVVRVKMFSSELLYIESLAGEKINTIEHMMRGW